LQPFSPEAFPSSSASKQNYTSARYHRLSLPDDGNNILGRNTLVNTQNKIKKALPDASKEAGLEEKSD
jgi:hypothetical protein